MVCIRRSLKNTLLELPQVKNEDNARKVAEICGVDPEWLINYFCKPKLKVGTEWVTKGQTCTQAASGVAGIGRKIYELVFRFIVDKCNETLVDPTMKKVQYIGCLDIAGFEIFDYNGFEQICINFCNEKLQQFFNQHMFVLEQEEYVREGEIRSFVKSRSQLVMFYASGIEWANVDFGMDLQKCIDMFEKPMGLLAILEEESLFPKVPTSISIPIRYAHGVTYRICFFG
jgi:myosin heavy subunit